MFQFLHSPEYRNGYLAFISTRLFILPSKCLTDNTQLFTQSSPYWVRLTPLTNYRIIVLPSLAPGACFPSMDCSQVISEQNSKVLGQWNEPDLWVKSLLESLIPGSAIP
ncbi:hypothetical protein TKK_0000339 [Trichogramma kaykai]